MVSLSSLRRSTLVPIAVCLLGAVGLLVVAALDILPRPTLLRASFTVFGAVVALGIFVASRGGRPEIGRRIPPGIATKGVVALAAAGVIATVLLDSRLLPFAVVLPVGFVLVALQLRSDPSVPAVLTQLGALFLAPRLGKYLTTGFYFGGSDTFAHVAAVDALLRVGYTPAIPHGYDLYPVFHFLVGAVTQFTGLPAYDALVLTGIALFTLVVPLSYLLGASVFGSTRLGLLSALAVTMLEFLAYHAVYFYPQALAIVLLFVVLYATSRLRATGDELAYRQYSVYALLLVVTMVLTHHLTYLLLAAVAAAAVPVALLKPAIVPGSESRWEAFRFRWQLPGIVGAVLLLTYWAYSPSLILVGIVELSLGLLFNLATIPGSQLFTYGAVLAPDSIGRAIEWLLTPTGLYATGLGSLLLLAAYELLDDPGEYRRGFTLAVTGLGLAALLLPLPLPIPQIERFRSVVSLVALFPLAIGLHRALSIDRRYAAVALLLLATVGGATAFTVLSADDMEGVYTDERRQQVEMSADEYRSVRTTSTFLDRRANGTVSTDWLTNRAFETARYETTGELQAEPDGLQASPGLVVVRSAWTDHIVLLGNGVVTDDTDLFTMSDKRFESTDALVDKVYTTGHVSVYHDPDGARGLFGENGTAAAG